MTDKESMNNDNAGYVRMSGSNDRSDYSLAAAFRNAGSGIAYAFKTQRNIRVDAIFAAIAVMLGIVFRINAAEWACIFVCIGTVMGFEIMNTAVESVVDLVSPDYHILAKHAKDCAAGAVYVVAIASVFVAAFIFLPRLVSIAGIA